jgi:serine/threonine protein kinase/tetratricopeptide (TPR) repeat protein
VRELFDAALELPTVERSAFVTAAADGDGALHDEVMSLLDADAGTIPILDGSAGEIVASLLPSLVPGPHNQRVGPYRLLHEIGRGGMGTVYLAEREDVGKRVALKLVRGGLASPQNVERLLRERRVLAGIEHPNIAALLDAGTTPDGLPFFAMEYVQGQPIDRYCDERDLGLRERLALFESVCEAVAYAHGSGIVHRDLKPSNILVAFGEQRSDLRGEQRVPEVKLLDFGIARVLQDDPSAPDLTGTGMRLMTPEYAAPEQVRGDEVGAAADVYSLGVILYRLITGRSPYLLSGRSLGELERAVTDQEPLPPSLAARRSTDRRRPAISGDLDRIVLQALAKEPDRRYSSAAELLEDLSNHRLGLPVNARVRTVRYRAWRWATRNRAAVLMAGLACFVLSIALHQFTAWAEQDSVSEGVVAVLPFSFEGADEHAYLSEGMVSVLSSRVNASGELRAVDSRALIAFLGQREPQTRERGSAAARHFRAEWYVKGEVRERESGLILTASLYRRREGRRDRRTLSVRVDGPADSLVVLLNRLSTQLLTGTGSQAVLTHTAALSSRSLPAMRWYLEGEAALREGRQQEAVRALQQAIAEDSTFALASLWLSKAALWEGGDLSRRASDRAVQLSSGLPPADSLLILAWNHYHKARFHEAEELYRRVLAERPDDVDAWYQLGELIYHWGPSLGRPASGALEAFERTLRLEPGNAPARIHLIRLAALDRRFVALDSLVAQAVASQSDTHSTLEARTIRAYSMGTATERNGVRQELATLLDDDLHPIVRAVLPSLPDPGAGLDLATLLTDPFRAHEFRMAGRVLEAQIRAAAGQPIAARRALTPTGPDWGALVPEYRAALALSPLTRAATADLRELRQAVANTRSSGRSSTILSIWPSIPYEPQQIFILGMLDLRLGHTAAASAAADRLATGYELGAADLGRVLRGYLRQARGDPGGALAALGEPRLEDTPAFPLPFSYPQAYGRWLRAELLRELGREEEALRWYSTFPDPAVHDLMFVAPSHLRRAQIHQRRGERQLASEHLDRFREIWRNAEPAGAEVVSGARLR